MTRDGALLTRRERCVRLPDEWAMRGATFATFATTASGGSFGYPFVF